jgi:hypothetical protein
MTEQQNQGVLPALYNMTKQQALIAGIPAGVSVIADIATHANPGVMFVGGLVALAIGVSSREVAEMVIPGSNPDQVRASLDMVVQAVTPEVEEEYVDQRALSKMRRLLHIGVTPDLYETQDIMQPGAVAAQPKDDTRHPVVDESEQEDEYLAPLPTLKKSTRNLVDLAPDLQIEKGDIVGKAIFVCGIRRHGKTTLGARLAEQLGKFYIPMFIPDLEGDYISLADTLPRAVIAAHSSADDQYQDYEFAGLDTSEQAFSLGYNILECGYQVILDMNSYAQLDMAVMIQVNVIRGMFKWANDNPGKRVPSYVYLDEAQRFLPQNLNDSVIKNKELIQGLLDAYMDILAIGGKRGLNPLILTQRFAQVNNKIMAQSEVFFLMRQTHDTDLKRCMEYASDPITKEQISKFDRGEGIYIATDGSQLVTRFHQRESDGSRSTTPQADEAQRYAGMSMMPTRSVKPETPAPSVSPSDNRKKLHIVEGAPKLTEAASEVTTKGHEGDEGGKRDLSELEMRIGRMFFVEGLNPNAIARNLWPDIKGGDAYQKKSAEVNDAIRKYVDARRGA